MRPYLRVANVFEDRIDTTDLKEMDFSGVFERFKLLPGDVLLNEGQTPELLGRPAIYRGIPENIAFTNTLIRFQAGPQVTPDWALAVFRHHMHSGRFTRESRITTNIAHLSATRFKTVEFPVPPLAEQRRIVDILEDHISRLDAADRYVSSGMQRLDGIAESTLRGFLAHSSNDRALGELLEIPLSNGRSVPTRDDGFPVLRLTALKDRGVDLGERKGGDWLRADARRFLVSRGDFLVARGNGSLRLVGRGSLVRDNPDEVAYPDTAIRVRTAREVMTPEYLDVVWNSTRTRVQIEGMARTTAGIYKVNQKQLAAVRLPAPSVADQGRIVGRMAEIDEQAQRSRDALEQARVRAAVLRRALLAAAFSGRLTGRHTDQEVIEELVDE